MRCSLATRWTEYSLNWGQAMIRIDGAYLYELGAKLRAIATLPEDDTTKLRLNYVVGPALHALRGFLEGSVFTPHIRMVRGYASQLLSTLESVSIDINDLSTFEEVVKDWKISTLKDQFRTFESTFLAELQGSPLYLVFSKGGFDVVCLTDSGLTLFPESLQAKAPEAVDDADAAAKCIAFEVFTAAGFHLHRATEAVLRRYFDVVAGEKERPKTRNIGDYLNKLDKLGVGDRKVIDVLRSLKDLHRNPLMHPEDSLGDADEALSLYAAVRAAIGYMLDRIPPSVTPTAPTV